jgi:hypothetical protein
LEKQYDCHGDVLVCLQDKIVTVSRLCQTRAILSGGTPFARCRLVHFWRRSHAYSRGRLVVNDIHRLLTGCCMLCRQTFSLTRRFISSSSRAAMARRIQVPFALKDGELWGSLTILARAICSSACVAAKSLNLTATNARYCCQKSRDKSLLRRPNARSAQAPLSFRTFLLSHEMSDVIAFTFILQLWCTTGKGHPRYRR